MVAPAEIKINKQTFWCGIVIRSDTHTPLVAAVSNQNSFHMFLTVIGYAHVAVSTYQNFIHACSKQSSVTISLGYNFPHYVRNYN
jgi:hypothetical protein